MTHHGKPVALAREFRLSVGSHPSPEDGLCAMEVVALLDGLPHGDHPRCSCELISAFVRGINDNMPDEVRQGLLRYLPQLSGTVSEENEQARHEFFAWQTVRVFAPAALRAQGFRRFASVLENAESLERAMRIAETVHRGISKREGEHTFTPVYLAVYHAHKAANIALWFADNKDDFFKGATPMTPFNTCAASAASAAFQAFQAGCDDIWLRAFEVLERAISIGLRSAMPPDSLSSDNKVPDEQEAVRALGWS